MKQLLRTRDAAKYLGVSESTLQKDRVHWRMGVPFHKVGRTVVYVRDDLDVWLDAQCRRSGQRHAVQEQEELSP